MEVILRAKASFSCWNRQINARMQGALRRNICDVSSRTNAAPADSALRRPAPVAAHPDAVVNGAREKWRFSVLVLFLPCAATFGLGTWQLFRRQWKIDILNLRRSRLEEDPVPLVEALSSVQFKQSLPQDSQKDPLLDSLEFRTVYCEGQFDEKRSLFVGPRVKIIKGLTQSGYYMVTPLLPKPSKEESGSSFFLQPPVLVNRGWVPCSWKDAARVASPQKASLDAPPSNGAIEEKQAKKGSWWSFFSKAEKPGQNIAGQIPIERVQGVVRGSEHPNMFVPSNVPETGQWFYVDVPAMARAASLPENTCYIEAMKKSDGASLKDYPLAKDPDALIHSSVMPQNHLNYALTWYSLSAATTFMAIKRMQKK
ncbi:hypothetical protein O6H91_02G075900 [Diphasiastrum complanatum]|uniref:Uncharacterized protein n=1 Tax=Diphasiastrum complanatum TaxID=34168 RepID=A0ACC2EH41_DIPCM|nr:hypothetical protein O6H91_02G075900 [Diphasiastrum complanatum]